MALQPTFRGLHLHLLQNRLKGRFTMERLLISLQYEMAPKLESRKTAEYGLYEISYSFV